MKIRSVLQSKRGYAASQSMDENYCALCVWLDNGGRQRLNTRGF